MGILYSSGFSKDLKKISRRDKTISEKIRHKLELFKVNRNHPSLRLHKLHGSIHKFWSISIEGDLRIIFSYSNSDITLLDLGKHEDVY